jgi:hypothetical protein
MSGHGSKKRTAGATADAPAKRVKAVVSKHR